MPLKTKDLTINQTMVAYGNWQNVTAFANNSDLLQSLKHLMETRLITSAFLYRHWSGVLNSCTTPVYNSQAASTAA